MTTFVSPIGTGFGDMLISLPVVQALLDRGEKVCVVTRCFRQEGISERVQGLSGEVAEEDLQVGEGDFYLNIRAHPIQTEYLWGTPEFEEIFGVTRMEKIITLIAEGFGLTISFQDLRPLNYNIRPEVEGHILFVPGTDGRFKHWPKTYWLELRQRLLKLGFSITMLGRPDESPAVKELLECGVPWLSTPTAGDAIDALSCARAVVAVDTGLMHAAIQQNVPTFSFVHPDTYHHRTAANSVQLIGRLCPIECGRDNSMKPGMTAAVRLDVGLKFHFHECPLPSELDCSPESAAGQAFNCMSGITVDAVLEEMTRHGVVKGSCQHLA